MPSDDEDQDEDEDHYQTNRLDYDHSAAEAIATPPPSQSQQQKQPPRQEQRSSQQQQQRKGLIWPYIQPSFESIYINVTYIMFLLIFFSKEVVYSLFAFADMACFTLIANCCMFILKLFGFYKDRNYINPRRMLLSEDDTEQGKARVLFNIIAGTIYGMILVTLVYNHEYKDMISWRLQDITNGSSETKVVQSKQNVELFRDAILSVLPSWVPLDADTGRIDSQELMDTLDDRYVMRQVQVPDFALATLGSRVLVQYTSPTFNQGNNQKGWRSSVYRWMQHPSSSSLSSASPVMALLPDTHPGQCWPMAGKYGSLGVRLSQPISVNAVSIDHADSHQVIDMSSAPKDFEVWGLTQPRSTATWKYPWDPAASLAGDAVYLGKFKYNMDNGAVQTFKITARSPPLRDIVFRFLSNWDKDEYTCIYRVRVHGNIV
ncbi:hypothetical protein K492DRAFT_169791 [Lichtheimia hyalospora FSU 10163]|nr:hypothetical protein K492DRAFT_169791 [Lichtheimia hyalospora FSU 10163]